MNKAIFKAYDIRGKYPSEINEAVVEKITASLGTYFKRGKIVVGHDSRLSSPRLYQAALRVLNKTYKSNKSHRSYRSYGIIPAGMITTPMLYFLVNHFKAVGGIMITASHNPKEYNGLKVVGPKAEPISGIEIKKLVS